jgi:hypothetical protein
MRIAVSPHASFANGAGSFFTFADRPPPPITSPFDPVTVHIPSPTVYAVRMHDTSSSFFGMRRHPSFFVQTLPLLVTLEWIRFEGVCCELRVIWYFSQYYSDFIS